MILLMTIVKIPTCFDIGLSHSGRHGTKEYKAHVFVPVMHFPYWKVRIQIQEVQYIDSHVEFIFLRSMTP